LSVRLNLPLLTWCSIPPGTAEIPLPSFDDRSNLQDYTIGEGKDDETMQVICQMINTTTPVTRAHGFAPDFGGHHNELIEEGDEQVISVETGPGTFCESVGPRKNGGRSVHSTV
jgi:hypothetical protein